MHYLHAGHYIKRISDFIEADANKQLEQFGITWSQARFLSYLLNRKNKTTIQKDIEEYFQIKHPTAIGILQRMEAKGLIVTTVDPSDKRQRIITPTAIAFELEGKIYDHIVDSEKRMGAGMTEEEISTLKELLYKVYRNTID